MFAILAFSLGGLVTGGIYSDAYADPGNPKACNDDNKGKAVGNKHCDGSSGSGSDFSVCDTTGINETPDGAIDEFELAAYLGIDSTEAKGYIIVAESLTDRGAIVDGTINTTTELRELNKLIDPDC